VSFIPRTVQKAISVNGLSQLRNVMSVFLKLDNRKFDSTETIAILQVFFLSIMQKCLADCSGFLCQFLVDDINSHHAEGSSRDRVRVNLVGSTTAQ
jgi:hypothetical protein